MSTAVISASLAVPIVLGLYSFTVSEPKYLFTYGLTLITAVFSHLSTDRLIPIIQEFTKKAGVSGKDLNKRGTPAGEKNILQPLGIVPGTIFVLVNMITLTYMRFFSSDALFVEHSSALLSICFCVYLGFSDDVLDLKWRYKLILLTVASVLVLLAYSGVTDVVVPLPLRFMFGNIVNLGILYYVFMSSLTVFCTNAINIYADINGLEVGQSICIVVL